MEQRPTDVSSPMAWRIPVSRWAYWGGGGHSAAAKPELGYIEPMLRRRLSPLAKAALHVAHVCASDTVTPQFVYASRHGELARTLEALRCLAINEVLSPTTFSLSVLNSAAGIFSIARQDFSPATAISAGVESFGLGLLEAHVRARVHPGTPVLFVYGDAPAPAPLGPQRCDPEEPVALAMLIDANTATHELAMTRHSSQCERSDTPQVHACLSALNGHTGCWTSGTQHWQWELRTK